MSAEAEPTGNGGAQPAGDDGPPATLSYEQARDQLTEVVRRLEGGGLSLEQSLDLWERGERLAAICEQWLEGARARLAAAMAARAPESADPDTPVLRFSATKTTRPAPSARREVPGYPASPPSPTGHEPRFVIMT